MKNKFSLFFVSMLFLGSIMVGDDALADLYINAYWDIPNTNSAYQSKWDYDSNGLMNYADSLFLGKVSGKLEPCPSGKDCDFNSNGSVNIGDALVYGGSLQRALAINRGGTASGVINFGSGSGGTVTFGSNPTVTISQPTFTIPAGGNSQVTFNVPPQNAAGSFTQSFSGLMQEGSQFYSIYSNILSLQVAAVDVVYPTLNISCVLAVNKNQIGVGESATWTMTSDSTGYKIYWHGTKDGIPDVTDSDSGFVTNKTWLTDPYPTGSQGAYTRYFKVHQFNSSLNNNVACTSNTVGFSILSPILTPTLTSSPSLSPKASVSATPTPTPTLTSSPSLSPKASVSAALSSSTPSSQKITLGQTNVEIAKFRIFALGESFFLEKLVFSLPDGGHDQVKFITITGTNKNGSITSSRWALTSSGLATVELAGDQRFYVPRDSFKELSLTVDVKTKPEGASDGRNFYGCLNADIKAVGENSQKIVEKISTNTTTCGNLMTIASSSSTPTPTPTLTVTPIPTSATSYFTFSHKNGTLIAGSGEGWAFELKNGKIGDKLSANAVLTRPDGTSLSRTFRICTVTVTYGNYCSLNRPVSLSDVGVWREDIYINGEFKETVNFTVVSPDVSGAVDQTKTYSLSEISDGDIIRGQGDIAVWIVKVVGEKRFKRWLFGPQIFTAYGHLGFDKVKNVNKTTLSQFDTAVLIRQDGEEKVYELTDFVPGKSATRRWIPTAEIFLQRGFDFDSVYVVNGREHNLYTEGLPLPVSFKSTKTNPFTANVSEAMARFFGLSR